LVVRLILAVLCLGGACGADEGVSEDLLARRDRWRSVLDAGAKAVVARYESTGITIESNGAPPLAGLYQQSLLRGHIEVEADLGASDFSGLVLFRARNGKPDLQNFVGLSIRRSAGGEQEVRVECRRRGRPLPPEAALGDSPEARPMSGRRHVLDRRYSMPFDATNGRVRVLRNQVSGVFHLYYGVSLRRGEREHNGWIELAPVPDWMAGDEPWCVGLVTVPGDAGKASRLVCRSLVARRLPVSDRDDRRTGFAATRRSHTWSGFGGDAVVVSFDRRHFPFADRDYKFVFWDRANYVPVWRFDDQTLFCYEFVETWDDEGRGCYEPMSDRLGVSSRVAVVEDHAVRKVVEWRYELLNPDYQTPSEGQGEQRPEAVERYACYPDGRIVRHVTYFPKLDGPHRNWNELGELIVVAGSRRDPAELIGEPGLSLTRDGEPPMEFFPGPERDLAASKDWGTTTATAHLRDHAPPYIAFANDPRLSATTPGNRVRVEVSWHHPTHRMSHWPVGLEPYQTDDKSNDVDRHRVTHTSLLGIAAEGDTRWEYDYQTDKRGRRYREWAFLLGLDDDRAGPARRASAASSWLDPGTLDEVASPSVRFRRVDRRVGEVVLETKRRAEAAFVWRPASADWPLVNPCFRVLGLGRVPQAVERDGVELNPQTDYAMHHDREGTLVWLRLETSEPLRLRIGPARPGAP
jgi:hypothetical protein